MYTIEYDYDEVSITILDDYARHEDLIVNAFDDIVYFRQYDPDIDRMISIAIAPSQWDELISAINSPEGAFITRTKHVKNKKS
jgi:hypothetical protein